MAGRPGLAHPWRVVRDARGRAGWGSSNSWTVHAFRNASARPARQLVIGPPQAMDMIAELSAHPCGQWEKVHERHRPHYARSHPTA
jgi:hypothetical protein